MEGTTTAVGVLQGLAARSDGEGARVVPEVPGDGSPDGLPPVGQAGGPAAGDPRPSWEEVAERYGPTIYTMAYRLTGDPDEAADLAQDVFLRVYRNLHRYEPGTFEGWLYRITKNLFLDRVRRRSRVRFEPLPEEEWRAPVSEEPTPADVVERRTLEAALERGLQQLPEHFRLAVVLCDVQGLTYEEVAAVTGWPMGTVRSRIHRGRAQLRDHLAADQDAELPRRRSGPDGEHGRRGRGAGA